MERKQIMNNLHQPFSLSNRPHTQTYIVRRYIKSAFVNKKPFPLNKYQQELEIVYPALSASVEV